MTGRKPIKSGVGFRAPVIADRGSSGRIRQTKEQREMVS